MVEDPHDRAVFDATRRGVVSVNLQQRLDLDGAQAYYVDEGRVQEIACWWRNHGQWEFSRAAGRLVVGQMVGQAVLAQRMHSRAEEFAASGRRRKIAVGERCFGQLHTGEALCEQLLVVDRAFGESAPADRLVVVRETGLVEAHAPRQLTKHPGVAARLATRRHGRTIQQHIGVAVAGVNIPVLQLRRSRQQVVGVIGGVGLKLLEHHGEKILAREALHHLARIRRHRHRVAVVNHDRFDRTGCIEQGIADGAHVDGARAPASHQIGPLQRGTVDRKLARAAHQQPAGAVPPSADQRRQASHGTRRVAAAAHPLHAVIQPDGGRLRRAVSLRQRNDLRFGHATHRGRARRRPLHRAFAQRVPAQRVLRDVIVIEPIVDDELVHQRQRQGAIGARQQRDVFVAFVGGFGLARVDAHQLRAGAFGGLRMAPEMQVAADRIAAPDQDQLGLCEKLDPHADLAAERVDHRLAARGRADGAVEQRRAQLVKEAAVHRLALHQTHGPGVAVRQDRFRVRNGFEAGSNVVERRVP